MVAANLLYRVAVREQEPGFYIKDLWVIDIVSLYFPNVLRACVLNKLLLA